MVFSGEIILRLFSITYKPNPTRENINRRRSPTIKINQRLFVVMKPVFSFEGMIFFYEVKWNAYNDENVSKRAYAGMQFYNSDPHARIVL